MHQGQGAQRCGVTHCPADQHHTVGASIDAHALCVVGRAVQSFSEGDVRPRCQAAVVGGVKRGVGCDHRIVCDIDGIGAAGAHQAATKSAAAGCIGLKVGRCCKRAYGTAVCGVRAVVHQHPAGAIERATKRHAHARESGGVGGSPAHGHAAVVGLRVGAGIDAATIHDRRPIDHQVATCRHGLVKSHRAGRQGAVATEMHRAGKAQGVAATAQAAIHGGGACTAVQKRIGQQHRGLPSLAQGDALVVGAERAIQLQLTCIGQVDAVAHGNRAA